MGADPVKKIINRNTGGVGIMNKSQKELVLMDCRIMLQGYSSTDISEIMREKYL